MATVASMMARARFSSLLASVSSSSSGSFTPRSCSSTNATRTASSSCSRVPLDTSSSEWPAPVDVSVARKVGGSVASSNSRR